MFSSQLKLKTISDADGYKKFIEKENDIIENVKDQQKSKAAHIHCNSEQIELGKTVYNEHVYNFVRKLHTKYLLNVSKCPLIHLPT